MRLSPLLISARYPSDSSAPVGILFVYRIFSRVQRPLQWTRYKIIGNSSYRLSLRGLPWRMAPAPGSAVEKFGAYIIYIPYTHKPTSFPISFY